MFAEANTSAGAPCWICAASAFEPPKSTSRELSIAGKTLVSDAAAYTVICGCAAEPRAPAGSASRRQATTARTARRLRRNDTGGLPQLWTITFVDLTMAVAAIPSLRPSSSTASR